MVGAVKGWERFFEPVDKRGKDRFLIRRDHLKEFIVKQKADQTAIDRFNKKFFKGESKKSWIGVKGEYDQLVVTE